MRFKNRETAGRPRSGLASMIDIIFLLLIFFVFSARFLLQEFQLNADLPRGQGYNSGPADLEIGVNLVLEWLVDGTVRCRTAQYHQEAGNVLPGYTFPYDPNSKRVDGAWRTETLLSGKKKGRVVYDYRAPDFTRVEAYLARRKAAYETVKRGGRGLPVSIAFDGEVPWQMVVNLVDMCTRLRLTEVTVQAEEVGH